MPARKNTTEVRKKLPKMYFHFSSAMVSSLMLPLSHTNVDFQMETASAVLQICNFLTFSMSTLQRSEKF